MLLFDSSAGPGPSGAAGGTIAKWLEAAKRGAVIVTSNKRAARFLLREFHCMVRATGAAGWATPSILTWTAWLQREWQRISIERSEAPLLLSGPQEHALWLQIVAASGHLNPYAHAGIADLAQQTWTLLHDHAMDLGEVRRASHGRIDWEQFSRWADKFQSRLTKERWLTPAQLAAELRRRVDANQWKPPAEFIAWGFDFFTPAQERLLQSMQQNCHISRVAPSLATAVVINSSASGLATGSREDEFRAASHWAKLRLESDKNARLAIITTHAAEDRGALQRALSLELGPAQFAFTLGRPLSQFPLAHAALLLLEFERSSLAAVDVSDLLLAPELTGSKKDHEERSLFEANVFRRRDTADPAMDLPTFTNWLRGAARPNATSLQKLLRQCQAALRLQPRRKAALSAEEWAEHFAEYLAAFHYPANALNSAEFQAWESWQELLQGLAASAVSGERLTHADALATLNHLATQTIFQPESGDAALEIMGPLEAAGSLFDGIFFVGCTDNRWPLAAPLNPLLPPALQRSAGVPGAVAGATLDRAVEMTQRISNSAPEVIFSHAQRGKDGPLRPSPVLARLQIAPLGSDRCEELLPPIVRATPSLERSDDTLGPAWAATGRTLSTSALKSQAACPFQAFALHRLHARGQELPEEGFDPSQRGLLLHETLRRVWSKPEGLQTSEALHGHIAAGTLTDFVRQRVEECLPPAQDGWQREYFQIERERLTRLTCEWLIKIEMNRAPFVVSEAEEEFFPSLGPSLKFRVRPDRVDTLVSEDADERVLIDYKTGSIKSKEWQTPRMDEPQLPFYALFALDQPPVAIALGKIRGGERPSVNVVQARKNIFPGAKTMTTSATDYDACLADWRADLELLAHEFSGGHALVDPKYGNTTCRYCTLQPLCRVHETEALLKAEEEEESEGADF